MNAITSTAHTIDPSLDATTEELQIWVTRESDLDDVFALSRSLEISPIGDHDGGFFVDALSRASYASALRYQQVGAHTDHVIMLTARLRGRFAGFLFGYNHGYAAHQSGGRLESDIGARCVPPYYIIRQVAIRPELRRQGIGRTLVAAFVAESGADHIYAPIVSEPENTTAFLFFRKNAFGPWRASSLHSMMGKDYPCRVWRMRRAVDRR